MLKVKTLKKSISAVTMFATVIALSGVSMLAPLTASAAIVDGALISSNATNPDGTPTYESLDTYIVKIVGTKKFKRLVLNPEVFNSYGHLNWNDIQEVDESVMDEYTTSSLVRVDGDDRVWALTPDDDSGSKSWIELTAEQFVDEAGSDSDSIYTINDTDAGNYGTLGAITTVSQLEDFYDDGTLPAEVIDGEATVALSSNTAESASLPRSAQYAPFTTLVVSAGEDDVTVTGLTVERTGLGSYADFSKIFVAKDGVIRGSLRSLPSSDEVTLNFATGSGPIEIEAGTSEEITIYANMATGTPGDMNAIKVTAVETNVDTVNGLPVEGNEMSVGSTSSPTATFANVSIGTSRAIGDEEVDVAKVKITNTNTNEDIAVNAITFKSVNPSSGTKVDTDDIGNFELFDGNTSISDEANLDASGYVVVELDDPIIIEKGGSKYETLTLKADILGGPGRKVTMDIYREVDLDVTGETNDFRTNNTDSFSTTTVTIDNADLAVAVSSSETPQAQTVLDDQTITLLKGTMTAGQGDVTATGMTVTLTGNDMDFGTTDEYENLKVYVDGTLISSATGSEISTSDSQTSVSVAFTDEFAVSGVVDFEVTIDVQTVTDSDWIKAAVAGSSMTATRDYDDASVTPTGTATGNKQTIGAATLSASIAAVPVSATRVKGSSDVEFLGFNLTTGNGDVVKVTEVTLALDDPDTGTSNKSDVSNIRIYESDGTTMVAGPENLNSSKQAVFTGLDIDLSAGSSTRYIVKADVNSTINDSTLDTLNLEIADVTAEDSDGDDIASISGGNTGTLVNSSGTIKTTLVDRGTLDVQLSTSTPDTHQVMATTTGDESAEIKLSAGYEDVTITKIILTAAAGSGAEDEISKVTLKNGSTVVASTEAIPSGVATLTIDDGDVVVPADGNLSLTVVTDYYSTNNSVADSGAVVQWTIADFASDIEADGAVKDVYGAVASTTGTGVTVSTASTATAALNGAITATQTTITYDTLVNTFTAGNVIVVGSEYMLITEVTSSTVLTVRRGIGGTTAAIASDNAVVTGYEQALAANSSVVYSNLPTVSSSTQPSGELRVGTYDAFKFTVTDQTNGEEDIVLDEVVLRVDGAGMSATSGWVIANAYLYNGSEQVGSTVTTDVTASGDLTFTGLESDADAIVDGSTTFTVRIEVALGSTPGTIDSGDTLQLSINDFGSANAAGSITGGDLDWQDLEKSGTPIEWVDTDLTAVEGSVFSKA